MQGRSVRPLFRRLAVPVSLLRPIPFGFAEIRVGIFSLLSFEQLPLIAMWSCLTVTCALASLAARCAVLMCVLQHMRLMRMKPSPLDDVLLSLFVLRPPTLRASPPALAWMGKAGLVPCPSFDESKARAETSAP